MTHRLPRRIDKPWGHEELWALTDSYAGKLLHVRAGHRLSLQHHVCKEETLRVMSGRMRLEIGSNPSRLTSEEHGPGGVFHLPPGTVHRFTAITDCVLVEVSTTQLDDVVRHSDDYGRAEAPS